MEAEYLLDGLNEHQLEAVTTDPGPVVVLAAAGSGKTRVLTRRIAWRLRNGFMNPNRVVALTFTRRAAEELRARHRQLGQRDNILAGTFHSVALMQLHQRWAEQGKTFPTVLDNKRRVIRQLTERLGISNGSSPSAGGRPTDVVGEIDWARARLITPDDYASAAALAERTPPIPAEQVTELMLAYQHEKRRRRVVDFDDLLLLAISTMRSDPAYAAAIRWRYQHLYVDEFQDINPLQFELLQEWRGDNDDLFVVGDPNQAIYGWNGADPQLLNRFSDREPDATVISLTQNYRSSLNILQLAHTALTNPMSAPVSSRTDGAIPTLYALADEEAEAHHIATQIRRLHTMGDRWSDQAVLTRTNAQLTVIAQVLKEVGIPARRAVGDGPLRDPAVQTELQALTQAQTDLRAWVEQTTLQLGKAGTGSTGHLAALTRLVEEYLESDPTPSGPGLAAWIGVLEASDVRTGEDAVDLLTFHSSKGLEWPIVHIAGLEDGFVPIAYATSLEQKQEEKRLLYVALTRGQNELHLTWSQRRSFNSKQNNSSGGGRRSKRVRSPLAASIERAIALCEGSGPTDASWRAGLRASRRELAQDPEETASPQAAGGKDVQTQHTAEPSIRALRLDALEHWRNRKAQVAQIEPTLLLSDAGMVYLAEATTIDDDALSNAGLGASGLRRYGSDLRALLDDISSNSAHPQ